MELFFKAVIFFDRLPMSHDEELWTDRNVSAFEKSDHVTITFICLPILPPGYS